MSTINGRGLRTVEIKTANYTVTTDDVGKTFFTDGAAGAVTFALPVAAIGLWYRFAVGATQELRIDPSGTETIGLPSSGAQQAAGAYIVADAIGEGVEIACVKAGSWRIISSVGTWTAV